MLSLSSVLCSDLRSFWAILRRLKRVLRPRKSETVEPSPFLEVKFNFSPNIHCKLPGNPPSSFNDKTNKHKKRVYKAVAVCGMNVNVQRFDTENLQLKRFFCLKNKII